MENTTDKDANTVQQPPVATVSGAVDMVKDAAAEEVKKASVQAQNLGQAGLDQVQNLGQTGVNKVNSLMTQIINPDKSNQPAVTKDEKIYGALAYLPFVALVSIIIKPDSAYVRLHAKQGLLLSLIFFFVGFVAALTSLFGIVGQLLSFVLGLVPLACLVIAVYSMYLAASGFWWKIPMLSSISDLIPVEWMAKTSKENITGQVGVAKGDYDVRQDTLQKEKVENSAPQSTPVVPPTTTVPAAGTNEVNTQQNK